jgi:ankyrin repeat protein
MRPVSKPSPEEEESARRRALRPNPNVPGAALFEALDRGDLACIRELLAQGADINALDPRTPLYGGETVLINAANRGNTEMVQFLLANGADVDTRSASGWTALMRACNAGDFDCARLLLDAGADPHIRNDEGYTAYGRIQGTSAKLLQLMRDHGANNVR